MKPGRRLISLVNALEKCEMPEQIFDAGNDWAPIGSLFGKPVTITSALAYESEFEANRDYAVIGFTRDNGEAGKFIVGGNAAETAILWQRFHKLPVTRILRPTETPKGTAYYWRKA